uniref:Uncharacterized protein n=1 Tax=Oryza rufipogon TaxID=4529 RepID=A0A0E0PCS9_ORYRU
MAPTPTNFTGDRGRDEGLNPISIQRKLPPSPPLPPVLVVGDGGRDGGLPPSLLPTKSADDKRKGWP